MKVVLFCGGQGLRIRDYSEVPKPMVPIGFRPILWHVMKYYAHFGHTEFILCLGYRADTVKRFFLEYQEEMSNDFVLRDGGRDKVLLSSDIDDWSITFVDTGLNTQIGERLRRVKAHIGEDEVFLANYADGLTDLDLNAHVDHFKESGATASFLAVRPPQSYHVITLNGADRVTSVGPIGDADLWLNAGYFVFNQKVFDAIEPGEDLLSEPFARLLQSGDLAANRFEGFWSPMDTFKEKQFLEELYQSDKAPWVLWD